MNIIQYLLNIIQYLYQQNCWLLSFICRYVPLKQWSFDDSHSPKYQKFKFIADGYSAYPLAAMEFAKKFGNDLSFSVTRVIGQVLNEVEMLQNADNMPAKWQILIYLGQQTILDMQKNKI